MFTYLEDEAVFDSMQAIRNQHRIEQLESQVAAQVEEMEVAMHDAHEQQLVRRAEEVETVTDRLQASTQTMLAALKRSDLPEDVYAAICVAIVTQQMARNVLRDEVTL